MSERQNREPEQDRERLRLLEFQLDYLRAELLHLTHERYRLIYSVSGHIYRFLRPIEAYRRRRRQRYRRAFSSAAARRDDAVGVR